MTWDSACLIKSIVKYVKTSVDEVIYFLETEVKLYSNTA